MKRAAIYARFSTDLQDERSIDGQVALCREFAGRHQLDVVAVHHDRAKSGASILGRDGLMALMLEAKARAFDVVVVEHSDRLSRDMGDLADIHKRLTFAGIAIRAVHSGGVAMDTASIGLYGLVGQLPREDGAKKVRRGLAAVIADGRHAGGRAYGYTPVAGAPGRLAIAPDEAAVVRRIFADYVAGATPRQIAAELNADRVAPPRGLRWNASTLNGNVQRGNGILQNEIYVGRLVWNKVRMVKDPETGRRVSRPNPASEQQVVVVPELAIVDAEIFAAANARKRARSAPRPHMVRRPPRLLSGLLRCGACGGGFASSGADKSGKVRTGCSTARESGSCDHRRRYYVEDLERVTVGGLRDELRDPRAIAAYVKAYRDERARLAGTAVRRRAAAETRRGAITRELERMVDAIAQGLATAATVGARILALEAERTAIDKEVEEVARTADVVALHPSAVARYLAQVERLSAAVAGGSSLEDQEARDVLRELVDQVIVHPVGPKEHPDLEICGRLAVLMSAPALKPNVRLRGGSMVAEEGLEPPTQGL